MPREDSPRHFGRRWWREIQDRDHAPNEAEAQEWAEHIRRFRPAWWPENEPWPPARRHWPRGARRSFFRRIGCAFLLFSLFVAALVASIVLLILNLLGLTSVALQQATWIVPLGGIALAALLSAMVFAAIGVRRMSMPLDEVLNASHRVAEGDYSVRVTPRGPAEVRSLAAAFNSMAEQLEVHERSRRSMLADVTHELRTPLTVIQGNLEGMLDGMYAADHTRLRSILEETQILSRLTEDLRTLSLAESGSLQLRREPTDLVALARDTIRAHQLSADASGVQIELLTGQDQMLQEVDPERIRQVLSNLISNAVRYSPRGSAVRVEIGPVAGATTIKVKDRGPGIAAEDLPHVFDRYYKSADSHGMGLGLAIAKYLVEAHGGQIQAESEPGGGTIIRFTLPS